MGNTYISYSFLSAVNELPKRIFNSFYLKETQEMVINETDFLCKFDVL